MRQAGIEQISVVRGYKKELVSPDGCELLENPRWLVTNMVSTLACAATWLKSAPCLVSYSDIFYQAKDVEALLRVPNGLVITFDPNWRELWMQRFDVPRDDAETFATDERGFLTEIGKRADNLDCITGQYMGLLRFTPDVWHRVTTLIDDLGRAAPDKLDMTGLLSRLIILGETISTLPISGNWGEIDTPGDLALYEKIFAHTDISASTNT